MFCAFLLANALRATATCHFSRSEHPKLVPHCGVLYILTCKCASRRHSGVPFCNSLLKSYLRTRRFSEASFRTSGTTNHWKNRAIRDFPNIWRVCILFLVTLRVCIFFLVTLLACWSYLLCWTSDFWLDFSTLLFNCPYCRKIDF